MNVRYDCYFLLVLAFALLLYPGCYRIEKVRMHEGAEVLYKVNRVTGEATLIANPLASRGVPD